MVFEFKYGQAGSAQHIICQNYWCKLLVHCILTHPYSVQLLNSQTLYDLKILKLKQELTSAHQKRLVCYTTAYTNKDQSKLHA